MFQLALLLSFICYSASFKVHHESFKVRPSTILQARRRTKLRRKPRADIASAPIPLEPSETMDVASSASIVDEVDPENENVVKTAPLVIKKSKEETAGEIHILSDPLSDDNWGRVPEDTREPSMMDSIQARLGGETPTSKLTTKSVTQQLSSSFQSDFDDFNSRMLAGADNRKQDMQAEQEGGIMKTLKDALSFVMVADFFVVMVFLVWFLAAAAMQKTDPWLLERFQDIFQPVVVPSLTVLMTGSIASGLLGDRSKEENVKR